MHKVRTKNRIRRNRILRTLLEQGEISLAELARTTRLSLPMVTKLIHHLRHEHLVVTKRRRESEKVGRPPYIARLNGTSGYILGIDIGRVNTDMVLQNLQQETVAELHYQNPPFQNPTAHLEMLNEQMHLILKNAQVKRNLLMSVGIAMPGFVNVIKKRGKSFFDFGKKSFGEILHERWRLPVHIENDAKAMALGERWFGSARDKKMALCINIGWGLGLGIIIDKKVFYGRDGYSGEFGHIEAVKNGTLCWCGKRGCLETAVSGRAIARIAEDRLSQQPISMLKNSSSINAADVVQAAISGDQFAIDILTEAGHYLGEGIAKLINIFNPEIVILGGRVAGAGELILNPVRLAVSEHSMFDLSKDVSITATQLGPNAGALGVAMVATRDLFEIDQFNPTAFV